jgi:acetyltransferase-like isoleucine patch superfamily enzyme
MNNPRILQASIRNVAFGENVTVVEPTNIYDCAIEAGCFVGPFCEIQKGVVIGERTKVQSHTFICELVTIGSDCFIGHGVMFINDRLARGGPAGGVKELWESTHIGNHVSIGSNATILPVTICDDVVIAAGAVVTKDITEPGIYGGVPAKLFRSIS